MFIDRLQENNSQLIQASLSLFKQGIIFPNTYVLDYDAILENARHMLEIARQNDVKLFYMLKQIGRNPIIAKALDEIGFDGCVAVDFDEVLTMKDNNCKLAHVGHLVQIPRSLIKDVLEAKPQYMTIYSLDKIKDVNFEAKKLGLIQKIVLRVIDEDSDLYSGQVGGFLISELESVVKEIEKLENIEIGGLTVFPALLYDGEKIVPTKNINAMNKAKDIMKKLGYNNLMINMPSCTCCNSIPLIKELGGNCGEPGHGLTGTTPLHKSTKQIEKIGYLYLSEVSHNFKERSYIYGGGHYRRSHMENALVGYDLKKAKVIAPSDESIDYHYELDDNYNVNEPVIMCYRTQVFTTRSCVAVVKGISNGNIELLGLYDGLGKKIK